MKGSNQLPEWENFGELFVKGILWAVGNFLLVLIFIIVPLLIVGGGVLYLSKNPNTGMILIGLGMLLMVLFILPLMFYLPLATVNFAKRGFLGFFEFVEVFNKFSLEYIILFIVVVIVISIISMVIQLPFVILKFLLIFANPKLPYIVDVVIAFINSFVGFFLGIFQYRVFAKYYKKKE
ncbi:DUF4013 domain-containing protein [Methanotorris formicicus]|uniref:Glycerophosphoryl diester phosphodiesterase membrane domain-containing protein n=1 Tax=Methanotorris formicicus Mc-S-70 TaxID=647171 RepID=H1KYV2_9EURY|nr:DUF4013 domain-containing protein [Methanotorris formicicus]EHP86687.1 hypothetical protein MetfoDRAFT_0975 [Methanotorris formicicus Mc-S-70]